MRTTIAQVKEMKQRGQKIPMLTSYDYSTAKLLDAAGIPMILVGDSLGNVVMGYETTIPVTIEDMLHHTKAVVRATEHAMVVGDMPFMTYQTNVSDALRNAGRFLQEAGAQAVKLEGGEPMAETVHRLVQIGIPVMGHLGLTPQSVNQLSGYRVQGRTPADAERLLKDAIALEQAGAFSIVLECVPTPLARIITQRLSIPTIGIGAGPHCDGQIQIIADVLGLFTDFIPRHAKRYANLAEVISQAVQTYMAEVKEGAFPTAKESFSMDESLLTELQEAVAHGMESSPSA